MDSIDLAQEENEKFITSCLNNRNKEQLLYSSDNIQLKDEKGRVLCKICEEPISKKRLKAIPDAIYCIECAKEIEEEEKRR